MADAYTDATIKTVVSGFSLPVASFSYPARKKSLILRLGCRSRKQKRKNQPIAKPGIEHCHWFILPLLLTSPTMQFSLDRKQRRHKPLPGFNDLGRSVIPIFLLMDHFLLRFGTLSEKLKKIYQFEVSIFLQSVPSNLYLAVRLSVQWFKCLSKD